MSYLLVAECQEPGNDLYVSLVIQPLQSTANIIDVSQNLSTVQCACYNLFHLVCVNRHINIEHITLSNTSQQLVLHKLCKF